ncbi:helix-turn-helix domain-containing protein [Streptomyces sp. NPDC003857]
MPAEKFEEFVDEIEVDFVVRERTSAAGLERGEQKLVAARLADRQVTKTEIARLTGVSTRTVRRWIAEERAAA